MSTDSTPDRAALLALCERGFVPQEQWRNRDSSAAQRQLGEAYALLRAGCDFFVDRQTKHGAHWVVIEFRGFDYFEGDYDGRGPLDNERFYIPTAERLDANDGGDWY